MQVKQSMHGDEFYTPQEAVDMIVPYIQDSPYRKIWCPFDTDESLFSKTFKQLGFDVVNGHIETGDDFFDYQEPQGEIVVSNPPFSKRDLIFEKLFEWNLPFALVMNFNGLFDSKRRHELFKQHEPQVIIPRGRMAFIHGSDLMQYNRPNFQSVYICHKLLRGGADHF